jgi:hypothetical protein
MRQHTGTETTTLHRLDIPVTLSVRLLADTCRNISKNVFVSLVTVVHCLNQKLGLKLL